MVWEPSRSDLSILFARKPVQECALFTGYRYTLAAGASSFGMSGVNAHGLFTASAQPVGPPLGGQLPWRAVRLWLAPQNVAMLQRHWPGIEADTCRHDSTHDLIQRKSTKVVSLSSANSCSDIAMQVVLLLFAFANKSPSA